MSVQKGVLESYGVAKIKKSGIDYVTVYSMIEIGGKEFRNIEASDLTSSYIQLALGKEVELLLGFGGSLFSKRILGIRYDGKLRKERFNGPMRGVFSSLVLLGVSFWIWITFGWIGFVLSFIMLIAALAAIKNLIALLKFS